MKELDFMLALDQLEKVREEISQKKQELSEYEKRINQEEKRLFRKAAQSGVFRISLGEFVKEYKKITNKKRAKIGKQEIEEILLVDTIICRDANGERITNKADLNKIEKVSLNVDIIVDGYSALSLEDIELNPDDRLADGTWLKDALKDNGCADMLMFKNEALLRDVIVDFSPESSAMKSCVEVRDTVLEVVAQKAVHVHEHFKD